MNGLTLSPSNQIYAVATVALLSASGATLTGLIHSWRRAPAVSFLSTYATTIGIIVVLALTLLGMPTVAWPSPKTIALALAGGLVACWAALRGESLITRALLQSHGTQATRKLPAGTELIRPDLPGTSATGGKTILVWLLLIGAGEEILFRGVLISLAWLAPGGPVTRGALIAASIVAFALAHAQLGLGEALRKMPLSIACFLAYLLSGTLLAPIAAHLGYNAWMWRARSRRSSPQNTAIAGALVRRNEQ
jgi:membrane protease YdiL (CAAX protease family)